MWYMFTVEYDLTVNEKLDYKICKQMNRTRRKYTEWSHLGSEKQVLCIFTQM